VEIFQKNWPHRLQDYRIKVKKRAFFAPYKVKVSRLWISLVNFFSLLKAVVFDIIVVKWVEIPQKKNLKKELFSFLKRSLSRKRYVMKGKIKPLMTQI
jgi:hypothetical protein